jgi:regulator of sigma E protease
MEFLQYPLALIVTLGVLVTFHEFGHFIVARWSGVRVVRFSIGFGKPLFSRVDKHGTEFVIAAIPLGGYVRMLGEQEPGEVVPAVAAKASDISHEQLSVWWRMAIAAAGPIANFLLAIGVYWVLFVAGSVSYTPVLGSVPAQSPLAQVGLVKNQQLLSIDGKATSSWQQVNTALAGRLGDTGEILIETRTPGQLDSQVWPVPIESWHQGAADPDLFGSLGIVAAVPAIVAELVADGPAAQEGSLQQWDLITAVDGNPIENWFDWVEAVQEAPGQRLEVQVARRGEELTVSVTPGSRELEDGSTIGFVGIAAMSNEMRFGLLEAIPHSLTETWDKTALTLGFLKKMILGDISVKNLSSPIMIAKVAGDSARASWQLYLGLLALLSISLGVLNLLPIPILDGGHLVYGVAEVVTGKPVSERIQILGAQVGLVMVAGMVLLAVYNDVMRLL